MTQTEDQMISEEVKQPDYEYKDGGWAWVVTLACFVSFLLVTSFPKTAGIFYAHMLEEFNIPLPSLTIIGSTNSAISFLGAFFVVPLTERFGIRPILIAGGILQFLGCFCASFVTSFSLLFVFLAVILGAGNAMTYVTCIMAMDNYFDKKKSIALSLALCGASINVTVFSPTVEYLLQTYGFSGAVLIYSSIMLNSVACALVVFPVNKKRAQDRNSEHKPSTENEKTNLNMTFCKNPKFHCFLLTNLLYCAAFYIPSALLPKTAESNGISLGDISLTFSLSGPLQVLGRLTFGAISHRHPSHVDKLWSIFIAAFGLTMLMVPFSSILYHYIIFNVLSGLSIGGANLGYALVLKTLTELKHYGRAISIALLMQGVGSLVGNPFAAFLLESTGDVGIPFYFGSCILLISAVLLVLPFSKHKTDDIKEIEIEVDDDYEFERKQQPDFEDINNRRSSDLTIISFGMTVH